MDGQHFDLIAKWLATRDSRRSAIRGLVVGAVALGLGHLSLEDVGADCKKVGQQCAKDGDCCAGGECKQKTCVCKRKNSTCGHLCCPPDRLCVGVSSPSIDPQSDPVYKCICHDGFEEDAAGNCFCPIPCGDDCCEEEYGEVCCASRRGHKQCVLLASSKNNCGACGNACPKDMICKGGKCVCPPSYIDCDGTCIRPSDDPANCGGCGITCPRDRTCQGGECVCDQDFLECEGTCVPKTGCCSDIDCWVYGDDYFCCNGPGCGAFDVFPYQCVISLDGE